MQAVRRGYEQSELQLAYIILWIIWRTIRLVKQVRIFLLMARKFKAAARPDQKWVTSKFV